MWGVGVAVVLIGLTSAALASPVPEAAAQYGVPPPESGMPAGGEPAAGVGANGNPFTGGLGFTPAEVGVRVGDAVRWTNTDAFVPHTVTEDHHLFNLTGEYGETPANPPGFGPGESRERAFEAGTFSYFCEVHPEEMKGVVRVPAEVAKVRRKGKRRFKVRWAPGPPVEGQVYDVERRRGGAWKLVRDGTTAAKGTFGGKGSRFRARLRSATDPAAASGWSPPAAPR